MRRTGRNKRIGLIVPGAVVVAADRAGAAAGPLRERVLESAGELAERTGPLRERVLESAGELRGSAAPVVGEALERGGAAWGVLRGDRIGPPLAVRRWPWALGAALAGAAAGAVVAAMVRKVAPADAPGAQEAHELRAVVDSSNLPSTVGPPPVVEPVAVLAAVPVDTTVKPGVEP